MNKIWQPILEALENDRKEFMYYVGATLCVELEGYPGVALNLNGKGFIYGSRPDWFKNDQVYIPQEVLEYVRIFYVEYKDNQEHYDETVKEY